MSTIHSENNNRQQSKTLLIACGALARETLAVIKHNGWSHLAVTCLPAKFHHTPQRIPEAIRRKIRQNRHRYDEIFVLYGDCGTGGLLDKVLAEEGNVQRVGGPHCFSFFMGNAEFDAQSEKEFGTFYLTDFFCEHFEKFVWQSLGLDRRDDMVAFVFGNYKRLVFMPQTINPSLEIKAQQIADRLGLVYEYQFCGYGDVPAALSNLSEVKPNSDEIASI